MMPRIRNIKPQFWIDENLGQISREARLLYIGLWNLSDDTGVFEWRPERIRVQLFPYDADVNSSTIEQWLKLLQDTGDIIAFTYNNNQYGYIKSFKEHQVINKPSKYTFAPIPEHIIQEDYSSSVVVVDEDYSSTTTPVTVGNRGEGNRLKGLGNKEINTTTISDGNIFEAYEKNIGVLYPMAVEQLKDIEQEYPEDWIIEAIQLSVKSNATNLRYIEGILKSWKANGKNNGGNNGKHKESDKWTGLPGNKPTGVFKDVLE